MKNSKKLSVHIVLWAAMILYFVFAPDLYTAAFTKIGKPLQEEGTIPAESDRISFLVDDLGSYIKDGQYLYNIYGWAFILPVEGETANSFVREVILISDERTYYFPVTSTYRSPDLPDKLKGIEIELDVLGFSALIAEDAIKPGKYRIGIVFRNQAKGYALYWDKPVCYLVKTPNTIRLERK
jgi:hypothetical protein